jgi:hypothetical protein
MYTSFDKSVDEVVLQVVSRILTGCQSKEEVAEAVAYAAVILLRGSGAFVDLTGTVHRPSAAIGTASDVNYLLADLEGIPVPEEEGNTLWGRYSLYRFKNMLIGVVDPEVLADVELIKTLAEVAEGMVRGFRIAGRRDNNSRRTDI